MKIKKYYLHTIWLSCIVGNANAVISVYQVPNLPSLYSSPLSAALGGLKEGLADINEEKHRRQQFALEQKQVESEIRYIDAERQSIEQEMRYRDMSMQNKLARQEYGRSIKSLDNLVNSASVREKFKNVTTGYNVLVFSQNKKPIYLGCLSCSSGEYDSLHSGEGSYGGIDGEYSIFNSYGAYGSKYSDFSACNQHASHPPVIIDSNKKILGLLTLNPNLSMATRDRSIIEWLSNQVCSSD